VRIGFYVSDAPKIHVYRVSTETSGLEPPPNRAGRKRGHDDEGVAIAILVHRAKA